MHHRASAGSPTISTDDRGDPSELLTRNLARLIADRLRAKAAPHIQCNADDEKNAPSREKRTAE